jgi:hypothetical protein
MPIDGSFADQRPQLLDREINDTPLMTAVAVVDQHPEYGLALLLSGGSTVTGLSAPAAA